MPNGPAAYVGLEIGARAGVHTTGQRLRLRRRGDRLRPGPDPARPRRHRRRRRHRGVRPPADHGRLRADAGDATRNDEPERASRPFDKGRDGFVLGEGAGVLVLERASVAAARGRTHLRRARRRRHHLRLATTSSRPTRAATAQRRALHGSRSSAPGSTPADVVHVNAHATSTPAGDVRRGQSRSPTCSATDTVVTATKSMTGHLLGAAGAIEAIATVLTRPGRHRPADDQPGGPRRRASASTWSGRAARDGGAGRR